jgi:hypothetical protein
VAQAAALGVGLAVAVADPAFCTPRAIDLASCNAIPASGRLRRSHTQACAASGLQERTAAHG